MMVREGRQVFLSLFRIQNSALFVTYTLKEFFAVKESFAVASFGCDLNRLNFAAQP